MNVLLTTPPQPKYSILPDKYKPVHKILEWMGGRKPILGIQPPYGLMYLSSYLKQAGHKVFIMDGLLSSVQGILSKVAEEKVDMVGISTVSWNWSEARRLAYLLDKTYPHLQLAVGGAHVNGEQGKVLEDCGYFDYAFYGDSEESFCSVVTALSSDRKPELLDGIAYRQGNRIVASGKNAIIEDIDGILFPDRDSLGIGNYRPSPLSYRKEPFTAMFGSRGCPYQCTFCHTDSRLRVRSAENLVAEIELLQRNYGIKEILFFDDTFTIDKKRVFAFCELLLKKNIELSWSVNVRADSVSCEMLKIMKKAGCWRTLMGIESGSQRLLDLMRKKQTLEQVEKAVNIIKDNGMLIFGMFMFGIPTQTYAEGLETIKFMKKLRLDYVSVCNLTPFPGTEIYKETAVQKGFKGFDYMNMFNIAYVPDTMEESQLRDLLKKALREFYLRPAYIFRQLRNIRSIVDVIRYIRGLVIILLR